MPYIGRSTEAFGVRTRYTYTPSAGDTSVSGADVNGLSLSFTDGAYVDVFLNGDFDFDQFGEGDSIQKGGTRTDTEIV